LYDLLGGGHDASCLYPRERFSRLSANIEDSCGSGCAAQKAGQQPARLQPVIEAGVVEEENVLVGGVEHEFPTR